MRFELLQPSQRSFSHSNGNSGARLDGQYVLFSSEWAYKNKIELVGPTNIFSAR